MKQFTVVLSFLFLNSIGSAQLSSNQAYMFFSSRTGCFKTSENIGLPDVYVEAGTFTDLSTKPTQYGFELNEYKRVGNTSYNVKPTISVLYNPQDLVKETSGEYTYVSWEFGSFSHFNYIRFSNIRADGTYTVEVSQPEEPLLEPIDYSKFKKIELNSKINCPK